MTQVAVGVLMRPDGTVLLARRPPSKVYAGYWEFPGGKIEAGESPRQALDRELDEELNIGVLTAYPWITRQFEYPHATVRLYFFRVCQWRGTPSPVEHEGMSWERPEAVGVSPVLPANGPVLRALTLPQEYALTHCSELGEEAQLDAIARRLRSGLRLIQVREPGMERQGIINLFNKIKELCKPCGARVLVNGDVAMALSLGADGVHLPARQLLALDSRPALPWVGASCHDERELQHAQRLGVDFAVLGPVAPTPSHPGAQTLGWTRFSSMVSGATIPMYALGGVNAEDLERALTGGAHGIAMQRGAWR